MKETRGTETSQYPEEEKTKVIPKVAASEMGRAQTMDLSMGYGHPKRRRSIVEAAWKGRPKEVTVPYAKCIQAAADPEYHRTRETRWEAGGPTPQG